MKGVGVEDVLGLYERWGASNYDEDIAQLDHALQTAAHAAAAGASDEMVAAALLHDVGHLLALNGAGTAGPAGWGPHEEVGADFLAAVFGDVVGDVIAEVVRLHVPAKRYLCAVEEPYASGLSAGSARSLRRQGGPMSEQEAAAFEALPRWRDAVALRRWDDAGKVDGAEVPGLDRYEPLLRALAATSWVSAPHGPARSPRRRGRHRTRCGPACRAPASRC